MASCGRKSRASRSLVERAILRYAGGLLEAQPRRPIMNKSALLITGLVALAGFLCLAKSPAQVGVPIFGPLVKYEYKVTNGEANEGQLNKLGEDGWELVATTGSVANR